MGSVFVAGTEAGVGKTVVAGALARAAVAGGAKNVAYYQPFATDDYQDAHAVINATVDLVKPSKKGHTILPVQGTGDYAFNAPVSPHMGMGAEGGADPASVLGALARLCRTERAVVVEGYGTVMAPLRPGYFMADLIRDSAMSTLLVTTNRVGSLGLAAASALACEERKAPPVAFVVNCIDPGGYEPEEIKRDIEAVTGRDVMAVLSMEGREEAPRPARRGSLFGAPPGAGGRGRSEVVDLGVDGERLPEAVKRSAAAARRLHEIGYLDAVADVLLLGKEDGHAQEMREDLAARYRRIVEEGGEPTDLWAGRMDGRGKKEKKEWGRGRRRKSGRGGSRSRRRGAGAR